MGFTTPKPTPPVEVLLVDDDPADVKLILEMFKDWAQPHRITTVSDGEDALRFLRRVPPHAAAPRPNLILLDLNLPKMDGREVLLILRSAKGLQDIPVVVLTSSTDPADAGRSLALKAFFLSKPVELADYATTLHAIDRFWVDTVA